MKKTSLSITFLWVGVFLLITGIILTFLGAYYATWALLGIMGGVLGILLYIVLNYTEVRDFFIEYSTRQWANTIIFITLLIGIIIVIQMIANNHNYRIDLTPEGEMSLAPITKKVLKEVAFPIKVIGFYRREERQELHELLELYSLASKKFKYELYDLDRTPGLAKKYGVHAYGTAVVEVNGKRKNVSYPTEEKIINAILSLTNPEQKVIYFFSGHGEYGIEGRMEEDISYGLLKEALETENYLVKKLIFVGGKPIPGDASLVIIGGPKTDFSKVDLEVLDSYLKKGGKIIVTVDPGYNDGLKKFLKKYGIVLGDDIVVDPEDYLIEKDPLVPIIPFYITHPITENFTIPTVFPLVRSVSQGTSEIRGIELKLKSLARSGKGSWAESDIKSAEEGKFEYDPKFDQKGPVTIAMVGEVKKKTQEKTGGKGETDAKTSNNRESKGGKGPSITGKLVVFGDSDFLLNKYFELLGNKDLIMNTIHWMTEDEPLITIRRKKPSQEELAPVYLSPLQSRIIFIGVVIFQPILILAVGIVVAWRRRQKG